MTPQGDPGDRPSPPLPARLANAFPERSQKQLRRLWSLNGEPFDEVAAQFETDPDQLLVELSDLLDIGLLSVINGTLRMTPPRVALAELLEAETATMEATVARLLRMGGIVAQLGGESSGHVSRPGLGPGESWLDAQVIRGLPAANEFKDWIATGGDLRFLRPYHWRLPSEPVMAEAFADAVARGWSVRCIYPVEALRLARSTLDQHAAFGEQVRLMPEVPYQLALVGSDLALVVSGVGDTARTLVLRDPVLVRLLEEYFDLMWDDAVAMPLTDESWRRDDEYQMLLRELAIAPATNRSPAPWASRCGPYGDGSPTSWSNSTWRPGSRPAWRPFAAGGCDALALSGLGESSR